uniref:Uncharacterized protein n=1 Tax=Prasinoderma coloniale TaxID=156133 RepID=A0A7R9TV45_9VIRI
MGGVPTASFERALPPRRAAHAAGVGMRLAGARRAQRSRSAAARRMRRHASPGRKRVLAGVAPIPSTLQAPCVRGAPGPPPSPPASGDARTCAASHGLLHDATAAGLLLLILDVRLGFVVAWHELPDLGQVLLPLGRHVAPVHLAVVRVGVARAADALRRRLGGVAHRC